MKLAADANVLLSAVIGGRARLIFHSDAVDEVLTTANVFAEVEQYAALLARKKRLPEGAVKLAVASLPVSMVAREIYAASRARARKLVARRDPDDVELLALALHFKVPLWSNDRDFEDCGVKQLTTAQLLRNLGFASR